MNSRKSVDFIVRTAVVAALYAALTLSMAPISYGMIQLRLSEVMTLLAFINPVYIAGLTLGTLIANIASQLGMADMIFGTLATFISVLFMSRVKNIWIASLWPSVINGVVIGSMLFVLGFIPEGLGLAAGIGFVFLGEFVVVTLIGVPVFNQIIMKQTRLMNILKGDKSSEY